MATSYLGTMFRGTEKTLQAAGPVAGGVPAGGVGRPVYVNSALNDKQGRSSGSDLGRLPVFVRSVVRRGSAFRVDLSDGRSLTDETGGVVAFGRGLVVLGTGEVLQLIRPGPGSPANRADPLKSPQPLSGGEPTTVAARSEPVEGSFDVPSGVVAASESVSRGISSPRAPSKASGGSARLSAVRAPSWAVWGDAKGR
jgi:hypothetical protein